MKQNTKLQSLVTVIEASATVLAYRADVDRETYRKAKIVMQQSIDSLRSHFPQYNRAADIYQNLLGVLSI